MATINVTHPPYHAAGKGTTDDAVAFRKALAAARGGDTVYVPAGTYLLGSTVPVPSGITLKGDGARSLLVAIQDNAWKGVGPTIEAKSDGDSNVVMLSLNGSSGVTLHRLAFDVNTGRNYPQAIHINKGSKHVTVSTCTFTAPAPPGLPSNTMMAVSAADSTHLRVTDNRLHGMQLKMAGGNGTQFIVVTRNTITNPYQWGISFVGRSHNAVVTDAVISDNVISGIAAAGGIYFGDDHNRTAAFTMTCERIRVRGNHLSGTPLAAGAFIQGIICSTSADWVVSGNVITQPSPGQHTVGIQVESRYVGGTVGGTKGLVVSGNRITGPGTGIILSQKTAANAGGADPCRVDRNTLTSTGGIVVSGTGYTSCQVTGNTLNGGNIDVDAGGVAKSSNTINPAPEHAASSAAPVESQAPPPVR